MLMGHLQDGNTDSYVIRSSEIWTIVIFEVFLLDIEEKLSIKGSEMAGNEGISSVFIVLDSAGRKRPWVSDGMP